MCYVFFLFLFFRTLSEKTAKPIIVKTDVQYVRLIRRAWSVSCPWNGETFRNSKTNLPWRDSLTTFKHIYWPHWNRRATDHYTSIRRLVHWPLMGGLLHLVQWGSGGGKLRQLHIVRCDTVLPLRFERSQWSLWYCVRSSAWKPADAHRSQTRERSLRSLRLRHCARTQAALRQEGILYTLYVEPYHYFAVPCGYFVP